MSQCVEVVSNLRVRKNLPEGSTHGLPTLTFVRTFRSFTKTIFYEKLKNSCVCHCDALFWIRHCLGWSVETVCAHLQWSEPDLEKARTEQEKKCILPFLLFYELFHPRLRLSLQGTLRRYLRMYNLDNGRPFPHAPFPNSPKEIDQV